MMNTTYITNAILRALCTEIDPTVEEMEARVAEPGFACCHALTIRAGAAKAAQFAAGLAQAVAAHNYLMARAEGARGEYRAYLMEQAEALQYDLFQGVSGDPEIMTACGHSTVPVAQAIDRMLLAKA
jgi:hypothetical protein